MQAAALIASIKARFSGNKTARIKISADELAEWPAGAFDELLKAKLLAQIEPAQSLECDGCEQACFMPVHVDPANGQRPARAFIVCDKRDDVGRVKVDFSRLHQWQMTRAGFEKMERIWIVPADNSGHATLKKTKASVAFRGALERLLMEIERRAGKQRISFDRKAMAGRKVDLQAVAEKFDPALECAQRTFDDYLDGLCAFKRGARKTDFYRTLFPEYFK